MQIMEASFTFLLSSAFLFIFLFITLLILYTQESHRNLPPGNMGLPFLGESLEFLSTGRLGHPEKFILDRMSKFSPIIFKTSILLEPFAFLCGPNGNKFLFTNENKLVSAWWPSSVDRIFPSSLRTSSTEESRRMRSLLPGFLKPESLRGYAPLMDSIASQHFEAHWDGNREALVYPLAKAYTFSVACRIFLSLEDPVAVERLSRSFEKLAAGIISIPVDFPGTAFCKGIKAAEEVRRELMKFITSRKGSEDGINKDVLEHMLRSGMDEDDVADKILGLLIGGHDTASAAITFVMKFLEELPHMYEEVYKEQMEIAGGKREGELLNWADIQKMKYSWNVVCEVMRLVPPLQGGFRQAIQHFTYAGFSIPKGWKLYWSAHTTHKNPKYFPEPEKFDPSRFEGSGPEPYTYVPFGGGPRMCPGKEYARMEILVFMHNLVKRYKWKKILPDERIIVDPMPIPAKGLPVSLYTHKL